MTLSIFNATRTLPARNSLPAWAQGTNPWAQYMLLGMSCVSLFACVIIFWGYYKGGHRRAEQTAVYYGTFSICFFVFSLIMWIVGAAIYQHSKSTGGGQDLWGWSCAHNTREQIYGNVVNYALMCRLQVYPPFHSVQLINTANVYKRTGALSAPSSKSSSKC